MRPVCPECAQGKHRNCDGQALNEVTDEIVPCRCPDCLEDAKVRAELARERHEEWWSEPPC